MISFDVVWNASTHPSSPVRDLAIARAGFSSYSNSKISLGFPGIGARLFVKFSMTSSFEGPVRLEETDQRN